MTQKEFMRQLRKTRSRVRKLEELTMLAAEELEELLATLEDWDFDTPKKKKVNLKKPKLVRKKLAPPPLPSSTFTF